MDIEILITLVILFSVLGGVFCLKPHKSRTPKRRITSHRNGYGRDYDYRRWSKRVLKAPFFVAWKKTRGSAFPGLFILKGLRGQNGRVKKFSSLF